MLTEHKKILTALVTGCLLIAVLVMLVFKPWEEKAASPKRVNTVAVSLVKQIVWKDSLRTTGTISAFQGIVVKSELEGRVDSIPFESGQDVKAGDIILTLNHEIQQAQVNAANVQLSLAQKNEERQQKLYKTRAIATEQLEQAKADLQDKQAAIKTIEAQLHQAIIKAPFDGRLGIFNVQLGDYITKGQAIVNLNNINKLYVDFSIPETLASKVQKGQTIVLQSSAHPGQTFQGKVHVLETVIDPDTRSLAVRGLVDNPGYALLPGNFVNVTVLTGEKQQLLTIPQTAINYSGNGPYVFIVKDGRAQQTPVTLGHQIDQAISVLSGLQIGDAVISAGANKVRDGSLVSVRAEKKK